MLARKYRLPIGTFRSTTPPAHASICILKLVKNELGYSRFGIVIAKHVDKKAVERNRLRRLFFSEVAKLQSSLEPGYDMLCVAKKAMGGVSAPELEEALTRLLKKEKVLRI